ncbi:pilin [Candidatus Parcubacteria bacterium]|nr:pilin [Candidatus Parcubacteria bacterium]
MFKYFSKILTIFFFLSAIFLIVSPVNAALKEGTNPLDNLQVTIPGLKDLAAKHPAVCNEEQCSIPWIGVYIVSIFNYGIGVVGILAAIVLMFGGVIWIMAGGSAEKIGEAKKWIGASLAGLIIALSSYMILYQINPDLTVFKPIKIANVKGTKTDTGIEKKCCLIKHYADCSNSILNNKQICAKNPMTKDECDKILSSAKTICPNAQSAFQESCDDGTTKCSAFGGSWAYQTGIAAQLGDASPELITMLNCLRKNLPPGVGEISSISDSNYTGIGNLTACDVSVCPTNCQHACQSCHYGGGTKNNKSYAVDLGDEYNWSYIQKAISSCGAYVGYSEKKDDRIHISATACPKN